MAAGLSIDATDGTATLAYTDDKGDPQPAVPADAAPAYSSSDDTIVTVAPSAASPFVAQLTPVAIGDFVLDAGAAARTAGDSREAPLAPQRAIEMKAKN